MSCSVGVMAYNEAANIGASLKSVLAQTGPHVQIDTVMVVASGCTDDTVGRARAAAGGDPRLRILEQATREGKASAVNVFMASARGAGVLVLAGGDTRLEPGALEALLAPFDDASVGMTGGRPIPINSDERLMGRVVGLLWRLHHAVAMQEPKMGELVAFRPLFETISADTAVDEASLEAMVRGAGLKLVYAPGARVRMKGPSSPGEFLDQRRRIHAGHLRLRKLSGHAVSTMSARRALRALRDVRSPGLEGWVTAAVAVALEGLARLLGSWDALARRDHRAWKRISSTKDLAP